MMGEPQIIRTPSGDEMVVVPRAEYEALLAAVEEAQEDADDLATARRRWEEWNGSGRLTTPPDVARMTLEGLHVLEAFRRHRGMSVDDLAGKAGVDPKHVEAIEKRDLVGDIEMMSALAGALNIDPLWLIPSPIVQDK